MLVDWHDFVVVETISFDEAEELPAPLALGSNMHTTPTISEMVPTPKPPSLVEEANPPPVPIGGLRPVPEHLIRRGYAPALRDARSNSNAYAIDPLTGQQVRQCE